MSKPVVTTVLGPVGQRARAVLGALGVCLGVFKASLHSDLQQPGHAADTHLSWGCAGAQGPAHPELTVSDEDGKS